MTERDKETDPLKEILEGKSILIVEDEETIRELLRHFLGDRNKAEVTVAASGQEAWDILIQEGNPPPNLIITDWHMGPMEAPELIAFIRADDRLSKVPIILMSGNEFSGTGSQEERDVIARKIGANTGLVKPFDSLKTVKKLAENLLTEPTA